jgi:manganese/zinc/iron transport system permease protein
MISFQPGLDLFPLLAGVLAAVTCGLLGNFLVLRRLSLMGDAISHSVLPGLVIAFLISGTRDPLTMFAGAALAGIATVVLVEVIKRVGRVEPGAAMGVVFSVLFALGVLLIERAAARQVDLDADCVLHGQLETLWWPDAPATWGGVLSPATIAAVPRPVWTLLIACSLSAVFVAMLFKELRIAAFDPDLATTLGFNATLLHYLLMIFVAAATVASFEAVGSILVIAMLTCPAATARLLTDRLSPQIIWSVVIAIATGVLGYAAATAGPALFGRDSVNAAGSMTVMAGGLLVVAIVASPRHGLVARWWRRRALGRSIAVDDLLAALFRLEEREAAPPTIAELGGLLPGRTLAAALADATRRGLVATQGGALTLTDDGRDAAGLVVRRHRLWEHYLVDEAGLAPDHVHATAEQLEHLGVVPESGPSVDPHGARIPGSDGPTGSTR